MKKLSYLFFLNVIFLLSCKSDVIKSPDIATIELNQITTLENGFKVSFLEVTDSRCPKNNCSTCFPNIAEITLLIKKEDTESNIVINYPGCYIENQDQPYEQIVDYLGEDIKITIYRLTPYGDTGNNSKIVQLSLIQL